MRVTERHVWGTGVDEQLDGRGVVLGRCYHRQCGPTSGILYPRNIFPSGGAPGFNAAPRAWRCEGAGQAGWIQRTVAVQAHRALYSHHTHSMPLTIGGSEQDHRSEASTVMGRRRSFKGPSPQLHPVRAASALSHTLMRKTSLWRAVRPRWHLPRSKSLRHPLQR